MDQKRYGARYKARQRAVNLLFEAEFRDTDPVEVLELHTRLTDNDDAQEIYRPVRDYTGTLVRGVAEELDEVDAAISAHLDTNWTIDRLPAIDRAIMRIATWELLFNPEVPNHAAIKDGIELSTNYSTTVAPGYINVTLDGIAKNPEAHRLVAEPEAGSEVASEFTGESEEADAAVEATDVSGDDTDEVVNDSFTEAELAGDAPAEVADPSTDSNVEAAALAADNAELADSGESVDKSESTDSSEATDDAESSDASSDTETNS